MRTTRCRILLSVFAALPAIVLCTEVQAQRPVPGQSMSAPITSFRPGGYVQNGNGISQNHTTGSTYIQGQAVLKPSGVYTPAGNGYYRNQNTGNVYNPTTGSYTQGGNMQVRPGGYTQIAPGIHTNSTTGTVYVPNVGVAKPSGVYRPMGNGYYQNPNTGNVYNPSTGAYFGR